MDLGVRAWIKIIVRTRMGLKLRVKLRVRVGVRVGVRVRVRVIVRDSRLHSPPFR